MLEKSCSQCETDGCSSCADNRGVLQEKLRRMTVQELIEKGYLIPGPEAILLGHRGRFFIAGLARTGSIMYNGMPPFVFCNMCSSIQRGATWIVEAIDTAPWSQSVVVFSQTSCCLSSENSVVTLQSNLHPVTPVLCWLPGLWHLVSPALVACPMTFCCSGDMQEFVSVRPADVPWLSSTGKAFNTPTSFVAHCTGSSQSRARGWHRVTYNGHPLDHYRRLLCADVFAPKWSNCQAEKVKVR
jgi:hypothetical protein